MTMSAMFPNQKRTLDPVWGTPLNEVGVAAKPRPRYAAPPTTPPRPGFFRQVPPQGGHASGAGMRPEDRPFVVPHQSAAMSDGLYQAGMAALAAAPSAPFLLASRPGPVIGMPTGPAPAAPVAPAPVAKTVPAVNPRPVFGTPLNNPSATPGWMAGGNGIEAPQNQGMQAAFAQNAPAIRGAMANAAQHGLVGIAKATGRELAKTGQIVGNAAVGAGKTALFGVDANSPAATPSPAGPPVGLRNLASEAINPALNAPPPVAPFAPQPVPQGGPQVPVGTPQKVGNGIMVGGQPWTGGSTNPDDVQGNVEKSTPAPMIGAASATRNGVTIGSYTAGQNRNTARQAAVEAERSMAGGQGTPGLSGTFLAKYRPEDAPVMSGIVRPTAADAARARILASAPSRFDAQGRQIDTRARDEQQAQAAQFQQQKDLARMQGQTAVDVATKQAETAMGIRNLNAETKANEIALQNQGRLDATNAAAQAKADAVGSSEKTKSEVAGLLDELATLDMTKPKSGLSHLNPWNEDPSADDLASKRAAVIKKLKLYGYDENGQPLAGASKAGQPVRQKAKDANGNVVTLELVDGQWRPVAA